VHDDLALRRLRHVDHPLHHVVGVLVLHHGVQGAVRAVLLAAHLVNEQGPLGARRVDHTLLHHVAADRGAQGGRAMKLRANGHVAKCNIQIAGAAVFCYGAAGPTHFLPTQENI